MSFLFKKLLHQGVLQEAQSVKMLWATLLSAQPIGQLTARERT